MTPSTSRPPASPLSRSKNRPVALLSVTDKTGLIEFARHLEASGYHITSTGGTASHLREAGITVQEVSDLTGFPEILSGRVKTLHPLVHGGILFDRHNDSHTHQADEHGIPSIEIVVGNLYQFHQEAVRQQRPLNEAIEFIDIGGPTMLRAAAKNYLNCYSVIDPSDYDRVAKAVAKGQPQSQENLALRLELATKVFKTIAAYDLGIAEYLTSHAATTQPAPQSDQVDLEKAFPETVEIALQLKQVLRYGENPQQRAAYYQLRDKAHQGIAHSKVLQGKELSYNNILDCQAAIHIASEFEQACVAIIKHNNPCGCAVQSDEGQPLLDVYQAALSGDPKSAFGGIVVFNRPVDQVVAAAIREVFYECIVAPSFTTEAREILAAKKNLRLLEANIYRQPSFFEFRHHGDGGVLCQSKNPWISTQDIHASWELKTGTKADEKTFQNLVFADRLVKHVKSNAIVLVKDFQAIGVGAGQMSRIDSLEQAIHKARDRGHHLEGAVLASDAFFPFSDCVELAHKAGIKFIVQPGGSIRDEDSIKAAEDNEITMYFSKYRSFLH